VSVLITALRERVPQDLLASQSGTPKVIVIGWLVQRLDDKAAMAKEAAQWAVESWALALGLVDPGQLAASPAPSTPSAVTPPPPPIAERSKPTATAEVRRDVAPPLPPPAAPPTPVSLHIGTPTVVAVEQKSSISPFWFVALVGFLVAAASTFLPLDGPRSMWAIAPPLAAVVLAPAVVGALLLIARRLARSSPIGHAIPIIAGALYPVFGIAGWIADSAPPPSIWVLMGGGAVAAVSSFLDKRQAT
jgi:hypothetical protein